LCIYVVPHMFSLLLTTSCLSGTTFFSLIGICQSGYRCIYVCLR
jgi:hypothetical protein